MIMRRVGTGSLRSLAFVDRMGRVPTTAQAGPRPAPAQIADVVEFRITLTGD
jgi:hypothetical protein